MLTVAAGILVLLFVCIIALCVRWKLKGQHDVNNQAIYNHSTVSSSGGYATTKPHTRSSWACTYKAGRQHQGDTHIWETPLSEPSADEYTLPTNMRQPHSKTPIPAAMLDSMDYTKPVASARNVLSEPQDEYTQPVKLSDNAHNNTPTLTCDRTLPNTTYYYYDPSSSGPAEYMQPSNLGSSKTSGETLINTSTSTIPASSSGVPIQETVNPVYKTLHKGG